MSKEQMETLAAALYAVAQEYSKLADIAMKNRDRHMCARMVRREIEAANRARAAELGNDYRI